METETLRRPQQVTADPRAYVTVLASGYLLSILANQIWPTVEVVPGLYPSEIVAWAAVAVGFVLWLRCTEWSRSSAVRLALGLTLILWAISMLLELLRGPIPERPAVALGIALGLMVVKPPTPEAATKALTALGWVICAVFAISILLEALGLAWAWSDTAEGFGVGAFERSSYWLPLSDALGIDGRWAGPFTHPNRAGPVAALLLVFGLSRRGVTSWVFTLTGLVGLTLAASRSSDIAALAGILVIAAAPFVLKGDRPSVRASRVLTGVALAGVVVLLAAPALLPVLPTGGSGSEQYVASAMTGTGRTTIWPTYVTLWQQSPWTGVGARGIFDAMSEGILPKWGYHAHNTFLDTAARHGGVTLLLFLAVLGIALVVTFKASRRGLPVGLALLVVVIVNSLGHTVLGFVYPEVPLWVLLLAVMMSAPEKGAVDDG